MDTVKLGMLIEEVEQKLVVVSKNVLHLNVSSNNI